MKLLIGLSIIISLFSIQAECQIGYTELSPSKIICPSGCDNKLINLDFNNDSIVDLVLKAAASKMGAGCISVQKIEVFFFYLIDTALIFVDKEDELSLFNNLDTIQAGENYNLKKYYCKDKDVYRCPFIIDCLYRNCESAPSDYSKLFYETFTNKYIGLRLRILENYHYCWIKLSKSRKIDLEIKSFAYNPQPDELFVINDPDPTNIETSRVKQLKCFPNPVKDILSIEINNKNCIVEVLDISGKRIHKKEYESNQINISTESWENGVYIVCVTTRDGRLIDKIIKN